MKSIGPFLDRKYKLALICFDLMVLAFVSIVVNQLRLGLGPQEVLAQTQFWLLGIFVVLSFYIFGSYNLDQGLTKSSLLVKQLGAVLVALSSVVVINYILYIDRSGIFGRGILFGTVAGFFVVSLLSRILALNMVDSLRSKLSWLVLIDEKEKAYFEQDLKRFGFSGKIHFFNPLTSTVAQLDDCLNKAWSAVVVGVPASQMPKDFLSILVKAKFAGHGVIDLGRFYEKHWLKVPVFFLDPEWFISSEGFESITHPMALRIKRIFDILLSILIFIPALPVMLLAAIIIKLESPGPVVYSQVRTGKDDRRFVIYKFRSMRVDAEKAGAQWAQKNDSRITRVGKFIRLTRIDELPQLWNVLKGDMSFVGPRPERPEFNETLAKEIPYYNLRHMMRPGLTGWAQVLYPYGASIDDSREKLQYELYYAKHYNLLMDLLIFVKTIRVVLFGQGR
ncbi:exopolysaccharide biosynthesis polyprenyl glycosylphosphotransferase [Bdellovibrio reynosensis]|uniref:Exopolysaccharide biosynthesis polyprenyl glycosylphosphotransferase n=1 Tax=Bdellovibrio reynosensis TaxID=2835041 RepID=A0ABY4CBE3_9BACT|nr:exopolysaccharide biosynthesis polyprenyl glycosylphosphotransferase [Bdellovibrio reynosensis]UOF02262.1 exopolysaccharide biosynthesis polyprenyl glycosylphosphotransferase [Bdellovibrio reynosensis]